MKLFKKEIIENKKPSKKTKKSNTNEYYIVFGLMGFVAMKLIAVHDLVASQNNNNMLIYGTAFCIIIFLFAAAKLELFNVFKIIRQTIPLIRKVYLHMKNDYLDWKNERGYYAKKS